jgi:S-(hydroxymethyl)glutathione dehydrogenase/alcohol dehydrogenase
VRTCRAAILEAYDAPLVIRDDLEVADPEPGEVLVRLGASGVCRSDLHSIDWTDRLPLPSMLGHEGAGTVEAIGPGVASVKVGDRVVLAWVAPCGECRMCRRERPALCTEQGGYESGFMVDGTSRYSLQGQTVHHYSCSTFSEYVVVPEVAAIRVETDLPWEHLALIGCAVTTGVGAALNTAKVQPGDTVAVVGCGGVGLSAVQGARIAGASRIIAVDTQASKLALAAELGATDVVDASAVDPVEAVRELTGGVDHAFEALGLIPTIDQALRMTGRGGRTTLIGMVEAHELTEIATMPMIVEERSIAASWYGTFVPQRDWPRIVGWLESGDLMLDQMIERIALDDINLAFDRIRSSEAARQVVVFDGA